MLTIPITRAGVVREMKEPVRPYGLHSWPAVMVNLPTLPDGSKQCISVTITPMVVVRLNEAGERHHPRHGVTSD